jgi:hypothetical protein
MCDAAEEAFAKAREEGAAAEREACAALVESGDLTRWCEDIGDVRDNLAAQIRERTAKGGT